MIFIFPTIEEAQLFIERSPSSRVEISGVGVAACAACVARIATKEPNQRLILAGIAGSYDTQKVGIGEVVEVIEESMVELPIRYQKQYINPAHTSLCSVSSNTVNSSYLETTKAQIENMEGAGFFAICSELNIDFCEIRAISNCVGENFQEWKIAEAIESLTEKLIEIAQ